MRLFAKGVSVCLLLFFVLLPDPAAAQLVQCEGVGDSQCNFCELAELANRLINWLYGFMTLMAVVLMVYAGFKLVTSNGDTNALTFAKQQVTHVVLGFLLMLSAWLIVDTILKGVTQDNQGLELFATFDVNECGGIRDASLENYEDIELELAVTAAPLATPTQFLAAQNQQSYEFEAFGQVSGGSPYNPTAPLQTSGSIRYPSGVSFPTVNVTGQPGYQYATCSGVTTPTEFIDLRTANLNANVSEHFTLAEVVAPKASNAYGAYAYISPRAVAGLQRTRDILGAPLVVTSGYRSPAYNAQLSSRSDGVASCSRHMYGIAFDVLPPTGFSQAQVAAACRQAGAGFTKDDYSRHVHCDWR